MQRLMSLTLALLVCGCTALRPPVRPSGSEQIPMLGAHETSFLVDPTPWQCWPSGPCDTCQNMSKETAELSLGVQRVDGGWDIYTKAYRPGAVVELCAPQLPLKALVMVR
jgi:hypothetical protein